MLISSKVIFVVFEFSEIKTRFGNWGFCSNPIFEKNI